MPLFVLLGAIVLAALYVMGIFNSLQRLKTQIAAAIQEIGNQLKRQASLIPNLEASVKGYLTHEKDIFKLLTAARTSSAQAAQSGSAKDIDAAISNIQAMLPKIAVVLEDNPEIQANATVMKFMSELSDTADKLMYARRTVIDLTQSYNEKLLVFPSNIIAGLFGFTKEVGLQLPESGSHLSVSEEEMKDVSVKL